MVNNTVWIHSLIKVAVFYGYLRLALWKQKLLADL